VRSRIDPINGKRPVWDPKKYYMLNCYRSELRKWSGLYHPFPDKRVKEEISEMRKVTGLLDQAIEADSSEACSHLLEKSVEKFNHFWDDIATRCFQIEIYPDAVSAGK
jgi:hypothetical protein